MLINIYARSMMTAARQPCVLVRDIPPATVTAAEPDTNATPGWFAKMLRLFRLRATKARQARQPLRCVDLQNL